MERRREWRNSINGKREFQAHPRFVFAKNPRGVPRGHIREVKSLEERKLGERKPSPSRREFPRSVDHSEYPAVLTFIFLTRQWLGSSQAQVLHLFHEEYQATASNKAAAQSEKRRMTRAAERIFREPYILGVLPGPFLSISVRLGNPSIV